MIKITDLELPLHYDSEMLYAKAAERLKIERSRILSLRIWKRAVNAKDKGDIRFKMELQIEVSGEETEWKHRYQGVSIETPSVYLPPVKKCFAMRPIVVGCGPAGLFAALLLAQAGARPIVLERGRDIDSRRQSVSAFWHSGILDCDSNVQFGEGGAGAFSDGKLKIGLKDARKMKILSELAEAGAPPEILYLEKPHIGTDRLRETVKELRKKIIRLGGEVRFQTKVTEIIHNNGRVTGLSYLENGVQKELLSAHIVLAIGHSARDTFEVLHQKGVCMEQKNFAVGVRIEHSQALIDRLQYGSFAGDSALGAADYAMVVHLPNGRNVYTFCMCPGGSVVASTSEENAVSTNGMSEFARDGKNANSAVLVTLNQKDLRSAHPLAGVAFQRRVEAAAFAAGGGGYRAPVQRLEDFLKRRCTNAFGEVLPTYLPGTSFAEVDSYLPESVADSLRQAFAEMGEWMPGFYDPDAVLTGAETRSASPVKITRDAQFQALGIKGLYPCGEGAGYAGGIISAAADGLFCAEQILK